VHPAIDLPVPAHRKLQVLVDGHAHVPALDGVVTPVVVKKDELALLGVVAVKTETRLRNVGARRTRRRVGGNLRRFAGRVRLRRPAASEYERHSDHEDREQPDDASMPLRAFHHETFLASGKRLEFQQDREFARLISRMSLTLSGLCPAVSDRLPAS
jgi:hypothetical protein